MMIVIVRPAFLVIIASSGSRYSSCNYRKSRDAQDSRDSHGTRDTQDPRLTACRNWNTSAAYFRTPRPLDHKYWCAPASFMLAQPAPDRSAIVPTKLRLGPARLSSHPGSVVVPDQPCRSSRPALCRSLSPLLCSPVFIFLQ